MIHALGRTLIGWWGVGAAIALLLLVALLTRSQNAGASDGHEAHADVPPHVASGGGPNPCSPIVTDLEKRRQGDAFRHAGVAAGTLPAAFTEGLTATSFTCLSDNLAGMVTAVFVEFKDVDGRLTAVWLSASPDGAGDTDWSSYLHETYQDTRLAIETRGSSVVALPPTPKRVELRGAVRGNDHSGLSLWEALLRDLPPVGE